ncbi:MAG: O-antigen ligase family protein [Bacteroidetes bacterium]|nr:O-antigen ligase family protein [Bacteroidota bacterium]
MKQYFKENYQFLAISFFWTIAGILLKETALLLVPAALILYKYKGQYSEVVLTIFLINYLSDNRHDELYFAAKTKGYIIMLAGLLYYINLRNFPQRSKIIRPFIPFFIVAFLLFPRNPDPALSFQKTLSYFLLIAAIPNYFLRQIEVEKEVFLRKLIWLITLLYIIGLISIYTLPYDWAYWADRYQGFMGNPNGIGVMSTVMFLLIHVAQYHYPKMFTRMDKYIIYGVLFISLIMSGSRNSIFSIVIFLFFSYVYKVSPWIGFAIVILAAVVFQVINENLAAIFTAIGLGSYLRVDHLDNGSGRLIAWTYAWSEIQKHYFILGRGFSFEEYLFSLKQDWFEVRGHIGSVHNSFLAVWLNTGIIGLICFVYGILTNFIRAAKVNPLAFPCMFAIIFSNMFESWLQASLNPFTIIALLVLTLLQYEKPAAKEESPVPVL